VIARRLCVREVLDRLSPGVELPPEAATRARDAVQALGTGTPVYVRVLIGFGAWVGTWFLLSFVLGMLALVFRGQLAGGAALLGLVLVAGGVALRRSLPAELARQVSLVLSFTGQGLFIGGIAAASPSLTTTAALGFIVSVVMIGIFPDRVHRFVSTLGAAAALVAACGTAQTPHGAEAVAIALIVLVIGIWRGAPPRWRWDRLDLIEPVAAGAVVALFGLLAVAAALGFGQRHAPAWLEQGAPTTAAAALGLLWIVHEIFEDNDLGIGVDLLAASAAVVLLAGITWWAPAIVTTLLVIVLAFDRRSPFVLGLAVAFFLAFATLYYYNLSFTLLEKSAVLAVSGLLCLGAWVAVRRRIAWEGA
jgi:MFS family permease